MASTHSLTMIAAAHEKSKRGDNSPVTSKDFIKTASRYDLVKLQLGIGKQISVNADRIFMMGRTRLEAALNWRKADDAMIKSQANLDVQEAGKNRRHLAKLLEDGIAESKKLTPEYVIPNHLYIDGVISLANKATQGTAISGNAFFDAMAKTDPFETVKTGDPAWKLNKPPNLAAVRELMKIFNKEYSPGAEEIFKLDPKTGVILNLDELRSENSPLVTSGLMSAVQHKRVLGDNDFNQFSHYNKQAKVVAEAVEAIEGQIAIAESSLEVMERPGESAGNVYNAYIKGAENLHFIEEAAERRGAFNIDNMEQLKKELSDVKVLEEQNVFLRKKQLALEESSPTRGDQLKEDMAFTISSPWFHAWAADHGFDELGRVDGDENNMLLVDTYVQGRDDLAAMRAFRREKMRGAGRYGFKGIGTSEIVQVMIDGETIVGERLKYHAADRPGEVRILVPDSDEPILLVSPGDVDQIEVIETVVDEESPQDRMAKARLRRKGGAIKAAGRRARGEPSLGITDAAEVDGQFIVDPKDEGRNLSSDEYQKRFDDAVASGKVVAKVVDGVAYLVEADGSIHKVTPSGDLMEMSEEYGQKSELRMISLVRDAPSRRVMERVEVDPETKEGRGRPLTAESLASGMIDIWIEPAEGDEDYNPEFSALFDEVESQRIADISPESLGLARSADFSGADKPTYTNERNVGGMKFVDRQSAPTRVVVTPEPVVDSTAQDMSQAELDAPSIAGAPTTWGGVQAEIEAEAAAMGPRPEVSDEPLPTEMSAATDEPEDPSGLSGLTDEQQKIIRKWKLATTLANNRGQPGPPIPEGYELVPGEGLRLKGEPAPEPPPPPVDELDDATAKSVVDELDDATAKPVVDEPTGITPPTDAELDAMAADPDPTKPAPTPESVRAGLDAMRAKAEEPPPAELPADLAAALEATPEKEAIPAAEVEAKPKVEKKKEKRAKLADILTQFSPGRAERKEKKDDESDAPTDEPANEGQTKVKGTPLVVGQNTEPPPTPPPPPTEEALAKKKAEVKEQMDALQARRDLRSELSSETPSVAGGTP